LKHHYIWGRPNWQFGADYIGKKNLSQKCGDLKYIEIILLTLAFPDPVIRWSIWTINKGNLNSRTI
jgi:hypothetical protein